VIVKKLAVLASMAVLQCTLASAPAVAQSSNSCYASFTYCVGDTWPIPPESQCPNPMGIPYVCLLCTVASNKCQAICWDCLLGTPKGGEPINLANGNTFITQSDLTIPGLGGGLSLSRTWNSQFPFGEAVPTSGMFGGNWRSTYEDLIFVDSQGLVKYVRGTGGIWTLGLSGLGNLDTYSMIAPANENVSVAYNGTSWTLSFNTGEKRIFLIKNPNVPPWIGTLTSIIDRNGNTTNLTYDIVGRLTTVTDPASRHLYFSYAGDLVVGVSSDAGISLSYAYDNLGRLTTVTKPDLTTVSFQYDSQSMISAVLDTNGKVLEAHTYDGMLRGLTSSRANGVDAITVTYPFLIPNELP